MKRTATFVAFILLVLTLCTATAGASSSSACNLSITKFVIHPSTGTAPAKIGFTTYMAGNVTRVRYQVLNKTTGSVVASCSSYCAHCTKKHICTCSLTIKQAGTYDAKVIAYGTGSCSVTLVKKSAITIKAPTLTPRFACTVSGKNVTFTDSSIGETTRTWNFGDGSKSTAKTITHTYKKAGTYKVCLTACNSAGTCKSICKTVTVK
jgi:PKD repeat protein